MSKRVLAVLPVAMWVTTVVLAAAAVTLTVLTPASAVKLQDLQPGFLDFVVPLEAVAFATVGALIVTRRSNLVGWLMSAVAITYLVADSFAHRYVAFSVYVHDLPATAWAGWLNAWVWIPNFALLLIALPLLFPNGRLLTPRWRILAVLVVVLVSILTATTMLSPDFIPYADANLYNPVFGGLSLLDQMHLKPLFSIAFPLMILCAVAAAVSVVLRYRRAGSDERHQIKWVAASVSLVAIGLVAGLVASGPLGRGNTSLTSNLAQVFLIFVPVAVGVAVFRYRLYDIDVVISRTLVYGSLAAFITAVYVAIVVGIGTVVGSGGQPNLGLSILATAVVAVAFQPLRERLQKVANRIVYGSRATPYEVLSQFSEQVAESYAAEEVLPRMAKVLAHGTGAQRAEVWLRSGNLLRPAASWPTESAHDAEPARVVEGNLPAMPATDRAVEVRHQGELLGALTVTKRRGESMTPVEDKLLADLASQAGLVLKNVGLTAELFARLDDLRASRQRLVAAQDEERRKLERNLHDGAQQNLVALKVKLGLVELLADSDPDKAKALLAELKGDTDETLETVRDLARGIYPPFLADKGLAAALADQARKATLPVEVDADGVRRYPQEIEAAVYFCVLEALQNIQKYAHASHAVVRLSDTGGALTFEITDNGKGFDPTTTKRGSGITNMADRLDALGGGIELDSQPGAGTTLRATIPVQQPMSASVEA
jgi:signal transduction histidine kinase